jgi:O-antigen ligase
VSTKSAGLLPVIIAVTWSTLAFGAVYAWAYGPLLVVCLAAGAAALPWRAPWAVEYAPTRAFAPVLALTAIALCVQVAPLPGPVIGWLSPATDRFLKAVDLEYSVSSTAGAGMAWHPLSVHPSKTCVALLFLACLGIFLLRVIQIVTDHGPTRLLRPISVLGVVVALVGLLYDASGHGRVYGFWQPQFGTEPFGPFVNRNHFVGWMTMAIFLTAGILSGLLASAERISRREGTRVRVPLRHVFMAVTGLLIMVCAVLMTQSRSGIAALTVGAVVMSGGVLRALNARKRHCLALGGVSLGIALALAGTQYGSDADRTVSPIVARLGSLQDPDRVNIWADTLRVVRAFPLAGTGMNTFGTVTLLYQSDRTRYHFNEAHNDYLQILAEGGLLVTIPVLCLGFVAARELLARFRERADGPRTYWTRLGAVAGLAGVATQELVDFSLQIPANATLATVLLAVAVHRPRARRSRRSVLDRSRRSVLDHDVGATAVVRGALENGRLQPRTAP